MKYEYGDIVEVTADEGHTWIRAKYIMPSSSIDGAHVVEMLGRQFHFIDEYVRPATMGTTTRCPSCSERRPLECPFVLCVVCQAFVCHPCASDPVVLGEEPRRAFVCKRCQRIHRNRVITVNWDARGYPRVCGIAR